MAIGRALLLSLSSTSFVRHDGLLDIALGPAEGPGRLHVYCRHPRTVVRFLKHRYLTRLFNTSLKTASPFSFCRCVSAVYMLPCTPRAIDSC